MARYTGPDCKLCRREKVKLFLKGAKCDGPKCAIEIRPYPPGEHGRIRAKDGEFLQQIRETGTVPMPTMSVSVSSATGRYRLREALILPGQEYHVTGTCVENPSAKDSHDRNMIVQGQNEKTFLISWKAEQEVQQGLQKRALGMVFGGAALALFCLALLLGHLHMY